ncbi:MAG: hypothetical protein ACOVRB_02565, partial [Akkermansiaceae bacterium]
MSITASRWFWVVPQRSWILFPKSSPQIKAAILAAVQSGVRRAVIFRRRLWTAVSITALRWLW